MIIRLAIVLLLIAGIAWGRTNTPPRQEFTPIHSAPWSEKQALWYHAMAGPVPAFAADLAVLNVYNIYAQAMALPVEKRAPWWSALRYELYLGQEMDPYFRDIYRLTEGLLAYEAQDIEEAITILSMSETYMKSSDPLLAAAFLAHQELKNEQLALSLGKRAASQPDSTPLVMGFTTAILKRQSGCRAAIVFLKSRLETMPEKYQQGIIRRIRKLQEEEECREGI
ncbi:hypothetical protein Ga0123462_0984 [Mariprofundus ferrinatatus]|uniref:Tetratricopeptide repeat-containing protein n=1 Tax=Mariprofundus ferrinatatus TaxID=1921087 RepID=A0A2K8L3L9_9PROT|nr:hypothetical protein [Mariprofundus ferrinatatus]ATX81853.1 hypothetical protein Ga0123462_0984 [Mariprofundus ferrinatatus]